MTWVCGFGELNVVAGTSIGLGKTLKRISKC
jgi:hypothetical protein